MEISNDGKQYIQRLSESGFQDWMLSYHKGYDFKETVPIEKQITFSWCNMNAYTMNPNNQSKSIFPLFNRKNDEIVGQKQILKNVNGVAYPGELLVIMGSSGAGKTTLLNCMTFRNLKNLDVSGLICINNQMVNQVDLAANSAYIQQDELFLKYLTVKEHLTFQSKVSMPSFCTDKERRERVEQIMNELSLKKCEHSRIGEPGFIKGISGGERKRLAFASGLLTNPSLIFCDEPTTGLDSCMALNVMQMMKDLAKTGRTVITTIHQPSSDLFYTFDKLCLMAAGRTAFLGSIHEAESFFSSLHLPCPMKYNPADHYIQVLSVVPGSEENCTQKVNSICDAYQSSTYGKKINKATVESMKAANYKAKHFSLKRGRVTPYRVGWYKQMRALFPRSWLSITKNPYATSLRGFLILVQTIILSLVYYGQVLNQFGIQNIDGFIFCFILTIAEESLCGVIVTFCEELPLFLKEHKDGMYRTDVFFITKMLCDMPYTLIFCLSSTALCYYFVGLNPEFDKLLMTLLICFLLCQSGQSIGYFISSVAPDVYTAVLFLNIAFVPLAIVGGTLLNISSIPKYLQWIADLSIFKYSFELLMINQWDDVHSISCGTNSSFCFNNGLEVLDNFSISLDDKWPSIIGLIVLAIAFRILAFFGLLHKTYYCNE